MTEEQRAAVAELVRGVSVPEQLEDDCRTCQGTGKHLTGARLVQVAEGPSRPYRDLDQILELVEDLDTEIQWTPSPDLFDLQLVRGGERYRLPVLTPERVPS